MKANSRKRAPVSGVLPFAALSAALLAAGCIPKPPAPAPRPVAPPPAVQRPAPPPPPPTASDWRDAPITPGDWQWDKTTTGSAASFAGGQLVLRCHRAQNAISLFRAATGAPSSASVSITTTEGTRSLATTPVTGGVEATLPARDPLLDAMAFSRGRFAVQATGAATLYVPSWTEISRVIEDCR